MTLPQLRLPTATGILSAFLPSWSRAGACAAALVCAGCASYQPAPIDTTAVLADLRAMSLDSAALIAHAPPDAHAAKVLAIFDPSDGLSADEAAAVAVTLNPALRARRAEAGVARSELVEAGLLPDPSVEWDVSDGDLELLLPLLRPGERSARQGAARARIDEVRWSILSEEWKLKRDAHQAFLDLLAAQKRVQLIEQLEQIVTRTHGFFGRARSLGAATALQEITAAIQVGEIGLEGERLLAAQLRAWQALNALLGLPPDAEYPLQSPGDPFAWKERPAEAAASLTERALRLRPDLRELLATYDRSEARLRLAVARQWPELAIGTTLELLLPVFGSFNQPAIRTAWHERESMQLEVERSIHSLRAEVHAAVLAVEQARRQVKFLREVIEPLVRESLRLAEEAFEARQVTAGEILIAQRQVLDARVRFLDARIEHAKARAAIAWVAGEDTSGDQP